MQIKIGMDVAASEFLTKDAKYDLNFKKQPNDGAHVLAAQSLCDLYKDFVKEFPIVSIEDPFDQDDWSSWSSLQSSVDIQIVGDDLLVTNPKKIAEAIQKKACNGLLLKVTMKLSFTDELYVHLEFFMGVVLLMCIYLVSLYHLMPHPTYLSVPFDASFHKPT